MFEVDGYFWGMVLFGGLAMLAILFPRSRLQKLMERDLEKKLGTVGTVLLLLAIVALGIVIVVIVVSVS